MTSDGWQQVNAGLVLMEWSRLVEWNQNSLALTPTNEIEFESSGHSAVHPQFGRLICWIVFAVGAEYLLKGICLLKGFNLQKTVKVIRPPSNGEDDNQWATSVIAGDASVLHDEVTLGTLGNLPLDDLLDGVSAKDLSRASIKLLQRTIRNRDAHHYVKGVRSSQFYALPRLVVPVLNELLASLDQGELLKQVDGTADGQ